MILQNVASTLNFSVRSVVLFRYIPYIPLYIYVCVYLKRWNILSWLCFIFNPCIKKFSSSIFLNFITKIKLKSCNLFFVLVIQYCYKKCVWIMSWKKKWIRNFDITKDWNTAINYRQNTLLFLLDVESIVTSWITSYQSSTHLICVVTCSFYFDSAIA